MSSLCGSSKDKLQLAVVPLMLLYWERASRLAVKQFYLKKRLLFVPASFCLMTLNCSIQRLFIPFIIHWWAFSGISYGPKVLRANVGLLSSWSRLHSGCFVGIQVSSKAGGRERCFVYKSCFTSRISNILLDSLCYQGSLLSRVLHGTELAQEEVSWSSFSCSVSFLWLCKSNWGKSGMFFLVTSFFFFFYNSSLFLAKPIQIIFFDGVGRANLNFCNSLRYFRAESYLSCNCS